MRKGKITWKKFFHSHLFFMIGIGVLVLVSYNLARAQLKNKSIHDEIATLQEEVNSLEEERSQYEGSLKIFDTLEFLESEARKSLGYVKPGEKVVVIEDHKDNNKEEIEKEKSNPIKWWIYFFGKV